MSHGSGSGTGPVWPVEPHTRAKHRILRKHLDGWVPKLGYTSGRVLIIDGFAGPGEYEDGEEGSPIVALKSVLEHRDFPKLRAEFVFLLIESDPGRCQHLKDVAIPRLGTLPPRVRLNVRCGKFDETMMEILDRLEEWGRGLAPSFALVDPFGISNTPMSVIGRLLRQPKAEILITVMLKNINRFLEHPNERVHRRYDKLFGHPGWRDLVDAPRRLDALGDFYGHRLLENGARYVRAFRMIDTGNRPIYDLFFATKHIDGLKNVKRAMWSVDPGGGFRFSDREAALSLQPVLFELEPDVTSLRRRMCEAFAGQTKLYSEIEEWVLVETPFHDGHIKMKCLKVLEEAGQIAYLPPPCFPPDRKRRKGSFPEGCRIRFL